MNPGAAASVEHEGLRRAVHDLRNPLAVLRSCLSWLQAELAGHPGVIADVLDAVHDSSLATAQLTRMVEDLALLASLQDHGIATRLPVRLGPIVDTLVLAASARASQGTTIVAACDEALLATTGDEALLTRVLEAIIDAVLRGAAPGSQIEVRAAAVATGLEIAVAAAGDAGPFTEHDSLTGCGLALHVGARIAALHGGALVVAMGARAPRIVLTIPGP